MLLLQSQLNSSLLRLFLLLTIICLAILTRGYFFHMTTTLTTPPLTPATKTLTSIPCTTTLSPADIMRLPPQLIFYANDTFVRGCGPEMVLRKRLVCVGGSAKDYRGYYPKVVRCVKGMDEAWYCEGYLHGSVKLGETMVRCEGVKHGDDDEGVWVRRDSCVLLYRLEVNDRIGGKKEKGVSKEEGFVDGIVVAGVILGAAVAVVALRGIRYAVDGWRRTHGGGEAEPLLTT